LGSNHVYMDTDSIFVPPEHAKQLTDYFQLLCPYAGNVPLLKIEPKKENVRFYGISSKRYAVYHYENGEIELIDFKLHGLGHLTNPFPNRHEDWQKEIWTDILKLQYEFVTEQDLELKYANFSAISQLSITTPNILRRFIKLNTIRKEWKYQIKPSNFFLVGFQTVKENGKMIKPIAPYSQDPQSIVYQPFIDSETGEIKSGSHYFKPLSRTIMDYIDHPESKYEGDIGLLKRRDILADEIIHIGKEANNIDEQPLKITNAQVFRDKQSICQKILLIRQCDAEKIGVKRSALKYIKDGIRSGKKINLKTKAVKKLVNIVA
jgi:hypothetical protein